MQKRLESVKKVINTEAYSGGILRRAQGAALSKDDEIVQNITIEPRRHKKSYSHGRE